jgi:hypothetical protein
MIASRSSSFRCNSSMACACAGRGSAATSPTTTGTATDRFKPLREFHAASCSFLSYDRSSAFHTIEAGIALPPGLPRVSGRGGCGPATGSFRHGINGGSGSLWVAEHREAARTMERGGIRKSSGSGVSWFGGSARRAASRRSPPYRTPGSPARRSRTARRAWCGCPRPGPRAGTRSPQTPRNTTK